VSDEYSPPYELVAKLTEPVVGAVKLPEGKRNVCVHCAEFVAPQVIQEIEEVPVVNAVPHVVPEFQ
jgi:hypothetical protein